MVRTVLLLCASTATIFLVPMWKGAFQKKMVFDDGTMMTFVTLLDMFAFFALPAGMIADRYGPTVVILIAAVLNLIGYGTLYALVKMDLSQAARMLLSSVSLAVLGQGSIFCIIASLTNIGRHIIPRDKSKAIGLAMAWFSLSPALVSSIPGVIGITAEEDLGAFFLSVGVIIVFTDLSIWLVVRQRVFVGEWKREADHVALNFCLIPISVLLLGTFLAPHISALAPLMDIVSVLLYVSAMAAVVLFNAASHFWPADTSCFELELNLENNHALVGASVGEALRDSRFWVMFCTFAVLVGTGMTVNNILKKIAHAVDPSGDSFSSMFSLFAIGNTLSRMLLGYLGTPLIKYFDLAWVQIVATWVMTLGFVLLNLSLALGDLYLTSTAVFLCGFAFGAPWMLIPSIEMGWYGTAHFGAIHGVMMLSCSVGLLLVYAGMEACADRLTAVVNLSTGFSLCVATVATLSFAAGRSPQ